MITLTPARKGVLLIVSSAVGFAFLPIITRSIYALTPDFKPTDIGFWRFFFACLTIWSLIFLRERRVSLRPLTVPLATSALLGGIYAFSAVSAFFGLQRINASLFIVLFYTYPAMVALLSLVMGKRLRLTAWVALSMTLFGIMLTVPDLSQLQADDLVGVITAFLNAFSVALYFVLSSRLLRGSRDLARSTASIMSVTLLVIVASAPLVGGVSVPPNSGTWLLLLALAFVATVIPIFSMTAGIQLIGAPQASIISAIEPALAVLLATLILGESVMPTQWLGTAFIVSAVILLQLNPRRSLKPQPHPTTP